MVNNHEYAAGTQLVVAGAIPGRMLSRKGRPSPTVLVDLEEPMRRRLLMQLVAALCTAAALPAQDRATPPAEPALLPNDTFGRAVSAWIAAVNSGDSTLIVAFLRDTTLHSPKIGASLTVEQRAASLLSLHRALGELIPREVTGPPGNGFGLRIYSRQTKDDILFFFTPLRDDPKRLGLIGRLGNRF